MGIVKELQNALQGYPFFLNKGTQMYGGRSDNWFYFPKQSTYKSLCPKQSGMCENLHTTYSVINSTE
jgi:hypothetical protein